MACKHGHVVAVALSRARLCLRVHMHASLVHNSTYCLYPAVGRTHGCLSLLHPWSISLSTEPPCKSQLGKLVPSLLPPSEKQKQDCFIFGAMEGRKGRNFLPLPPSLCVYIVIVAPPCVCESVG